MNDSRHAVDLRAWDLTALEEAWARHRAQKARIVRPVDRETVARPPVKVMDGTAPRPF
jgi:hypothetical protein